MNAANKLEGAGAADLLLAAAEQCIEPAVRYKTVVADPSRIVPTKWTPEAAGYDLRSAWWLPLTLAPGERKLVQAGFACEIPGGCVGLICPRSGLALKHGVTVLNAPGVIDGDYRGEIGVLLVNLGDKEFTVHPGDRIAQLLIMPIFDFFTFRQVQGLDGTDRGEGGFGSTGVK